MFLDQVALARFYQSLLHGVPPSPITDESTMPIHDEEKTNLEQYRGVKLSETYSWDLQRFYRTFPKSKPNDQPDAEAAWTPVCARLKDSVEEIRAWAEITEQLIKMLEYSHLVLGKSWADFPGTQPWLVCSETLDGLANRMVDFQAQNTPKSHILWDWSRIREALKERKRIWDLPLPEQLDTFAGNEFSVHMGLRALGLGLERNVNVIIT